jgi:hypothetical protein
LRKLDFLVRRDVVNSEVRRCLMVVDESNNQAALKEHYLKTREYIARAIPQDDADRQTQNQAEA